MIIENLLLVIVIFISIVIIVEINNLNIIIYTSVLSLISVCLYYMFNAPDLALAEIAIGSAIIPLIFIISIAKQNEFIVISYLDDNFLIDDKKNKKGLGYELLENFCNDCNLKLRIYKKLDADKEDDSIIKNADLIIEKDISNNIYFFKGKKSNILMTELQKYIEDIDFIKIIKIGGVKTDV